MNMRTEGDSVMKKFLFVLGFIIIYFLFMSLVEKLTLKLENKCKQHV